MLSIYQIILFFFLPCVGILLVLYALGRFWKNAGIADAGWCACMAWCAGMLAWRLPTLDVQPWRAWLVGAAGVLWALRLGGFIFKNRVLGRPEDKRYTELRASKGELGIVVWFLAQAPFAMLFASSFYAALQPHAFSWAVPLAVVIWCLSVGGEALADAQLARFRADPANQGTTCRRGLWRYSRHPNYFFEWLHWLTYVLLAWGASWGIFCLSWLSPAVMLFMLFRVSGIPLTEKQALSRRGDDYREYQRTTSVFVPWPPKT